MPTDKVAHFLGGFCLCVTTAVLAALSVQSQTAVLMGFAVSVTIGRWKEWRDRHTGKGSPDKWDFWATVAGAVWGGIILLIK